MTDSRHWRRHYLATHSAVVTRRGRSRSYAAISSSWVRVTLTSSRPASRRLRISASISNGRLRPPKRAVTAARNGFNDCGKY
jgi:hypothetical protein